MGLPEVWCPRCQGPARVERNWRGDERVVCDAYRPCRPPSWRDAEPLRLSPLEWDERLAAWRKAAA